jgi:hypothetical protein
LTLPADDTRSALFAYTLSRGDDAFVHQHAVDALGAQTADDRTTPIQLTFALAGLFLKVERGYTGRQVQRVHAALAQRQPAWPRLEPPSFRGSITADDVLAAPEGAERDRTIDAWCAAVWAAYASCRDSIVEFLTHNGIR